MLAQWFSARIALRCALGVAVTVAALAILALGPPVQRVAADSPCAPKGDEKDASKYQGSNAFYLCQEGPDHFSTPTWGPSQELFITCRPSTLRAGTLPDRSCFPAPPVRYPLRSQSDAIPQRPGHVGGPLAGLHLRFAVSKVVDV